MLKKFISTTLLLTIGLLLFLPILSANAALWLGGPEQLIPETCTKTPSVATCNLCTLLELGKNIISFLIYAVAPALVSIFVAYGGIRLLISGGSEESVSAGKEAITVAITGYIIVLGSWLIVSQVFTFFVNSAIIPQWAKLPC